MYATRSADAVLQDACGHVNTLARTVIALYNLKQQDKDVVRAKKEAYLRLQGAYSLLTALYAGDEIPAHTVSLWSSAKRKADE